MVVQSGPGTKGTRHISKNYPVDEGLTAGTTKQTKDPFLRAEQSFVKEKVRGS